MNKEKFLKELEKRLIVLNDHEKKDIINEYRDTIEEKIKHGQTEKEAVNDFGDIDELAKEILSAYKINPDYSKKNGEFSEKTKDIVNDCEQAIKKGAKKMAEITDEVVEGIKSSNQEITLELVFEILIKCLILLVLIAVLKIPFSIISSLGCSLIHDTYFPFNILEIAWYFIVWILYIICCALIGLSFFRQYYKNNQKIVSKKINQEESIEETPKKKEIISPIPILDALIKIGVTLFLLIPLFFCVLGLIMATVIIGYLTLKGIPLLGVFILLIGISFLFSTLFQFLSSIAYHHRHNPIYGLIVGSILFIIGIIFSIETFINFEYINSLPDTIPKTVETHHLNLKNPIWIREEYMNTNILIDEKLEDGQIVLEVEYYNEFIDFEEDIDTNHTIQLNRYIHRQFNKKEAKKLYSLIINDLKKSTIYNYHDLFIPNITITVNSNTRSLIKMHY